MRIAIVGAGFTGLTAALRLSEKGHQVVIFEKEKDPGGLATGFKQKNWAWTCEYFFHHLFASDQAARNLISELCLNNKLFFKKPKTSIYFERQRETSSAYFERQRETSSAYFKGRISRFDSPISVLTFPLLSLPQKIRAGIATAFLKLTNNWQQLEKITAVQWLKKFYGPKTYQILWEPLLKAKFGEFYGQIPASWFWARIKKRSTQLGYLEGSFQTLINELAKKIKTNGGKIYLNHEITCFNDLFRASARNKVLERSERFLNHKNKFDKVIFTTPTSVFLKILKNTSDGGRLTPSEVEGEAMTPPRWRKVGKLKMLGALNLILELKESFLTDGTYWLNVNDNSFPFVAVVEHTNFIDKSYYGNNHILYVGGYYPQNHRYFKMKKEEILKEWLPYLQKINPKFDFSRYVIRNTLYANQFAQPIVPINYSKIIPSYQTPIKNVFLANMQQIYPWDRGINYAIAEGEKIAQLVT